MKRYGGHVKFIILLFAILLSFSSCNTPQKFAFPTITYGEFPFRIEYKIEGSDEIFVIEDTLICSFAGIELRPWYERLNLGKGKNLYEESLMSGQEECSFILADTEEFTVKYELGDGGYYMNDFFAIPCNRTVFVVYEGQTTTDIDPIRTDEWIEELKKYGVHIIEYTCAEPVNDNPVEYRYSSKYVSPETEWYKR